MRRVERAFVEEEGARAQSGQAEALTGKTEGQGWDHSVLSRDNDAPSLYNVLWTLCYTLLCEVGLAGSMSWMESRVRPRDLAGYTRSESGGVRVRIEVH